MSGLSWLWMEYPQQTQRIFNRADGSVSVAGRECWILIVEDFFFLSLLGALCTDSCSTPSPRSRVLVTAIWPASGEAYELTLVHCFTAGPNYISYREPAMKQDRQWHYTYTQWHSRHSYKPIPSPSSQDIHDPSWIPSELMLPQTELSRL